MPNKIRTVHIAHWLLKKDIKLGLAHCRNIIRERKRDGENLFNRSGMLYLRSSEWFCNPDAKEGEDMIFHNLEDCPPEGCQYTYVIWGREVDE